MSTLLFNSDTFSSLSTLEYAQQWENISLDKLWEDEQSLLLEFLNLAKGDSEVELNLNNVLLVKTNDDRLLDRVYGASIFRESENGDGLVLKAGANSFPITLNAGQISVGHLTGTFQWLNRKRLDESTYQVLIANLYNANSDDDDPMMYEIGCSLAATDSTMEVNGATQKNPLFLSQPKLQKLLQANAALGQFFTAPKTGGGSVFKMKDLSPDTEYEVVGVDVTEPHPEYGVSYILRLAGGASCFARGNSETVLKRNFNAIEKQLESGAKWTLKVGKITEYQPGKVSVNNALVARQAAMSGNAPRPIQQAAKAIAPAQSPGAPSQQLSSRDALVKWATDKGITQDMVNGLFQDINTVAQQKAAEGVVMSAEDKRQSFIDSVEAYLAQNPVQTLDAEVVAVAATTESSDIPF